MGFKAFPVPALDRDAGSLVSDDHSHGTTDDCSGNLTAIEKIVASSTGVSNIRLIRCLLKIHHDDSSHVIELLIHWMSEDSDGSWALADGPPYYDGPSEEKNVSICDSNADRVSLEKEPLDLADTAVAAAVAFADDDTIVEEDEQQMLAEKIVQCLTEPDPPSSLTKPLDDSVDANGKKQPKHKKGAARQKKTESKKHQKEMAKMKKRKAAREFHAGIDSVKPHSSPHTDDQGELDLAKRMEHIYI